MTCNICNNFMIAVTGGVVVTGGHSVTDTTIRGGVVCGGRSIVDLSPYPYDGLAAVWPLQEDASGQPDEYQDHSHHNLHGTGAGMIPTQDTGVFCLYSQYFGGRDYITLPDDNITNTFAVSCRVKLDSTFRQRTIFTRGGFVLGHTILNQPWARVITDDATYHVAASTQLYRNTWYHLACQYDGNSLSLFVNGVLVAQSTIGSHSITSNNNRIGAYRNGSLFQGWLQEVRLYYEDQTTEHWKAERDNLCIDGFFQVGGKTTAVEG